MGEGSHIIKYIGFTLFNALAFSISTTFYSIPFKENMVPSLANAVLIALGIIFAGKGIKESIHATLDLTTDQKVVMGLSGLSAIYIGVISLASNFAQFEWLTQAFQIGQVMSIILLGLSGALMAIYLGRKLPQR